MSDFDNTNRGALFKQDKQGNKDWSDYQGNLNVEGVEYWINAWLKTSKKGEKFMSLSVRKKDTQHHEKEKAPKQEDGIIDDNLPF